MIEKLKDKYNVIVHETDTHVVFTTNSREAAALLEKICDEANVTDNNSEFHYQSWLLKK
jgi:hypothetical protein